MDIHSVGPWPSSRLSNFAPNIFEFDGVVCNSMEGFLQSLKTPEEEIQRKICGLVGIDAKREGSVFDTSWQATQELWWRGTWYEREGIAYQVLLCEVYDALFTQNAHFRVALEATGNEVLTHSVGKADPRRTVLTEEEFCRQLYRLRTKLQMGDW